MLDPGVGSSDVLRKERKRTISRGRKRSRTRRSSTHLQSSESDLSENGTELSGSSGNSVGGRSVSGREGLSGDDEGGGVGSEVLKGRKGRGKRRSSFVVETLEDRKSFCAPGRS